jgi:hypothetical protein
MKEGINFMKKKSNHDKVQDITNKILKNNDEKKNQDTKDAAMRFEAGEIFDSLDFSPESWKKD